MQTTSRMLFASICLALHAAAALAGELTVEPARVTFDDALAHRQLIVSQDGRDVTRRARYTSSDVAVVTVDETGYLSPVGSGTASVTIVLDGTTTVSVTVGELSQGRPINFATEIVPLLSRYGCNSAACHGKAGGQNGFQLSLFGFDSTLDYQALVEEGRGRRVFPAAPHHSLLLTKAIGAVPHGGGRRFEENSEAYRLMQRWIASGVPASAESTPTIERLSIVPSERILQPGDQQQLAVVAEYSDGSKRDITRHAQYQSNIDVVAIIDESAMVKATGNSGEAAIMARYMGQVAVFRAIVPHGKPLSEIAGFQPANYIDKLSAAKWKKLGLQPSPSANDATFLRRVTLDVCGRLPTVDETRSFLADTSADKREKLIERLLNSPDYAAFFAMRWGAILRNSKLAGADQAAYAFHNWLKELISRNRPYDELVRGVVAAAGDQLVLANARRPIAPSDGRHRAGLSRHSAAMRPLPSSPLRALGSGRLLRTGRLLHPAGPQEFWATASVLFIEPSHNQREEPGNRQSTGTEIPRWRVCQGHPGRRPTARPGRLDDQTGQPVLRPRVGQPLLGTFPGTWSGR